VTSETVFTNAQIVQSDQVFNGTVVIADGKIRDVQVGRSQVPSAVDLNGDYLIPGLVELHTDNLEKHMMPRPGAHWPAAAAVIAHDSQVALAGITTVFDAVSLGAVLESSERIGMLKRSVESIEAAQENGHMRADHLMHLRCEVSHPSMVAMLDELIDDPLVKLVSIMDHTPGQRQFVKIEKYAEYYQGKYGLSDEALAKFIDARREDQVKYSANNRSYAVKACHDRGISLASHDDATADHVKEAERDKMVIAEFPTTPEAAAASRDAGMKVMMGGPNLVRGGSHSGNVSAKDLASMGHLDIVSSDYVPASLLHGALLLASEVPGIELPAAIASVSKTPAEAVGLSDRGEIAPGKRADLVHVHTEHSVPIVRSVWREGNRIA